MRISFDCTAHVTPENPGPRVNTCTMKFSDGFEVTLDRDTTEFKVDGEKLFMYWRGVYIWDGENADYSVTAEKLLSHSEITSCVLDIEDDAAPEYALTLICFSLE